MFNIFFNFNFLMVSIINPVSGYFRNSLRKRELYTSISLVLCIFRHFHIFSYRRVFDKKNRSNRFYIHIDPVQHRDRLLNVQNFKMAKGKILSKFWVGNDIFWPNIFSLSIRWDLPKIILKFHFRPNFQPDVFSIIYNCAKLK